MRHVAHMLHMGMSKITYTCHMGMRHVARAFVTAMSATRGKMHVPHTNEACYTYVYLSLRYYFSLSLTYYYVLHTNEARHTYSYSRFFGGVCGIMG